MWRMEAVCLMVGKDEHYRLLIMYFCACNGRPLCYDLVPGELVAPISCGLVCVAFAGLCSTFER